MRLNSLYSPTATATAVCTGNVYILLESQWQKVFKCEYVIIVEDFNARINVIMTAGKHGIGKNGEHHFAVGIIADTVHTAVSLLISGISNDIS